MTVLLHEITVFAKFHCRRLKCYDFGDYPGEGLIRRLAQALKADEDELLLLAEKVPEAMRRRVIERPDAFRKPARLDDEVLDRVLRALDC